MLDAKKVDNKLRFKKNLNQDSSNIWNICNEWTFFYNLHFSLRGHSNNTWHSFGTFPPPPPCVTFFNFWWLIFRPKLLWNIELIQNKVTIEALSCFVTKSFPSKSIKNSVSKSRKRRCDTSLNPPPPAFECHVLFEWPQTSADGNGIVTCLLFCLIL